MLFGVYYMVFGCHRTRFTLALTCIMHVANDIGSNEAICIINVLENSQRV